MKNILQKLFTYLLIALIPTLFCSLLSSPLSYGLPLNCPQGSRVIGIECFNESYENTTPWYRKDFGASELTFPFWLVFFGAIATWAFFSSSSSSSTTTKPDHLTPRDPSFVARPIQQPSGGTNDKSKLWLPTNCPHCGGSISINNVEWLSNYEARCPYCASVLKA